MRALAVIVVGVCAATDAQAAPWSFELPAGYAEEPGATDDDVAALRSHAGTISADAQLFVSPDQQVVLVRLTWVSKVDGPISRELLVDLDRKGTHQSESVHLSDERHWVGEQLVAESVESIRGKRLRQRRLYSVDTSARIHVFAITCVGSVNQLAACEEAQQSMQLKLPNEAKVPATAKRSSGKSLIHIIGGAAFAALVLGLIAWVVQSAKRGGRRRPRSTMRRY